MPIVNWVAEVLGWLMNGIYSIGVHNLGLCIIIFTLVIYAFMTPLQIKQQKFAKMNAVMAPELQNIQKKYRGKKDQNSQLKMQEETMGVYEKYGVSPTGSCLQMLIQMPIFFALYQVIIKIPGYIGGIKDVFASAVSHITDVSGYSDIIFQFVKDNAIKNSYIPMSGKLSSDHVVDFLYSLSPAQWDKLADVDKFQGFADVLNQTADQLHPMQNFLGLNIADNPWALIQSGWSTQHYLLIFAAVLIPVLAWATQVLNMKLVQTASNTSNGTPSQMETTMKTMNTFMPLMTAFICFTFPVGIGIYWIIGAVIRSVQQVVINRHLNNMDMDDFIKKNKAKMDKKKAKLGVTSQNISQQAKMNVRNIEEPKRATIADKSKSVKNTNTASCTAEVPKTKPGSLASKANMVAQFDANNKGKKK
ncbi:membrane protein insertase YidC [Lachnospiraceae bacterium AM25-11LB]|nr:membrane protein insertase YidC [Lachnospiraceae bacterium AM25-22]RGD07515.1 membrane protein insertase YidC [Lachnospiraceae bacterium AM25-11LB]RJW09606.1 membrane protein insertase YidC [Lachnospiraceae bacterium AM25-40]RJW14206.1 membrane protein insertase YidC [Lachnospiraceae bacterium AM25-39]